MTINDPTLTILRSQRNALIRSEIAAQNERNLLEQGVRDAINKLGRDINDVSDASGLAPNEIARILDSPPSLEDELAVLSGVC